MSRFGKVLRVARIKPHAPPLVRVPSIPLRISTLRSYSPGGVLNALAAALRGGNPLTLSTHRLRRGLPGYLILFDPHAFGRRVDGDPDRKVAFATGVPPYLCAFHRYTWNSAFPLLHSKFSVPMTLHG